MDLTDPTRAVTPTLDGTVLAVLAAAGKPMTVGQVAEQAARGSEIGIRRSLARLVEQGIIRATLMGRNQVHELNRQHIAANAAVILAGLRTELWKRFREELSSWRPRPLYAAVFGSAARGAGDGSSDVDLLLVHPPFPGEKKPARISPRLRTQIADALGQFMTPGTELDAATQWESQVDRLRDAVEAWTGNALQVVDLSFHEWRHPTEQYRQLFVEIERDGIDLVKARAISLWSSAEAADG
ncbi:MAG TPA: nucleotidyltransferase domain-containing protein [Mycobacteriales bacterium]|nr:nucleotidyltransferase domain-containing protein [Mycobacteriales bacterium]